MGLMDSEGLGGFEIWMNDRDWASLMSGDDNAVGLRPCFFEKWIDRRAAAGLLKADHLCVHPSSVANDELTPWNELAVRLATETLFEFLGAVENGILWNEGPDSPS